MQQRYYDPQIGLFLSVDPVAADGGSGVSFNRYKYAANSPYSFKDPDGRQECYSCERGYGASTALVLHDNPNAMRIWRGGEEAALSTSNGAEVGADIGEAIADFIDADDYSDEALGDLVVNVALAGIVPIKVSGGAEHTKGARSSTKGKHEKGQTRKQRDRGGEKGDKSRAPPRKPPAGHKGPWPPKPPAPPKPPKPPKES